MCLQTPDDGQRYCPKHVESYSKNKFEKLVLLVGFIIRMYHDSRSYERQKIHLLHFNFLIYNFDFDFYLVPAFTTPILGFDLSRLESYD